MHNAVIAQLAARRQLAIGVEGKGFEYLVGRRKFGDLFGLPLGGGQARESELVVRFSDSLDRARQVSRAVLGGGLAGLIGTRLSLALSLRVGEFQAFIARLEDRVGQDREGFRRGLAFGRLAPQRGQRRGRRQVDDFVFDEQRGGRDGGTGGEGGGGGGAGAPGGRTPSLSVSPSFRLPVSPSPRPPATGSGSAAKGINCKAPCATMSRRFSPNCSAAGARIMRLNSAACRGSSASAPAMRACLCCGVSSRESGARDESRS